MKKTISVVLAIVELSGLAFVIFGLSTFNRPLAWIVSGLLLLFFARGLYEKLKSHLWRNP